VRQGQRHEDLGQYLARQAFLPSASRRCANLRERSAGPRDMVCCIQRQFARPRRAEPIPSETTICTPFCRINQIDHLPQCRVRGADVPRPDPAPDAAERFCVDLYGPKVASCPNDLHHSGAFAGKKAAEGGSRSKPKSTGLVLIKHCIFSFGDMHPRGL